MCEKNKRHFSDDCQFRFAQIVCTIYPQKSSLRSTHEKSDCILFAVPFEKIELPRFGVSRRMKYLVARPTCTPIAYPRLVSHFLAFLRSVKFHFQPSPCIVPRCDKWRIFFLWFYILAVPVVSRCAEKKRERIDVRRSFTRCRQHIRATTMPRLLIYNRNDIISGKEISSVREEYYWYWTICRVIVFISLLLFL